MATRAVGSGIEQCAGLGWSLVDCSALTLGVTAQNRSQLLRSRPAQIAEVGDYAVGSPWPDGRVGSGPSQSGTSSMSVKSH